MADLADHESPLDFLAGHQRVPVDVECVHPDGGCACDARAQVCSSDDEEWPCERVRALIGGRIAGLRQAASLLCGAADRQQVPARQELLRMYADECELLAGNQQQRLFPADPVPPGLGLFGVVPPVEPGQDDVERFVQQAVRGRMRHRFAVERFPG